MAAEHPNILLLISDNQRLDTLGIMNQTPCQTPTWDRVAEAGTSKKRAARAKGVRTKTKTNGRKVESPSAASLDSLYLSWQQQQQQRAQAGRRSAPPSASNGAAWDACSQ